MKIRSLLLILMALLPSVACHAQELNDRTLLTVAGRTVPAGEFIRMYRKSIEPGKKTDIDAYLDQYIIFKLKVADAIQQGLDTTKAFRTELNGYRNQLAQNYLTDSEAKEKLLRKTYERSLTEINAWHILVNCPEGSKPEDTLLAWQKASGIRERILKGEPFELVARGTSDDPSVKVNGGNLGFFSVFQMITPFEDAAYSLKKGSISEPVRTPYGYHIIKVTDKRPSRGKVLVAHIMKVSPPGSDEKTSKAAEESINKIYDELNAGASFSELAKKYSDHKETANSGGKLNWFGAGEIIPDFSEAAFSIADTGKYTRPVRTTYAWHIIKLLDKKAPGSFEESRSWLESRINQSYLNSLSKKSFTEKLKKEYNFRVNQTSFKWFVDNTDTLIIRGLKKYDRSTMPPGILYSFANQNLTNSVFAAHIERRGSMIITDDPESFIRLTMDARVSEQILKYENSVLEKKYPDFRYLMKEFHDGILLFEISGRRVWNRVQDDSAGIKKYYEEHKREFLTKPGIEAKIYTLHSQKGEKKLSASYKKFSSKPGTDNLMLEKFNSRNDTMLVIKEGKWFTGDDPEIDRLEWSPGAYAARINKFPSIIVINRKIESVPLPFEEVQSEMITGFQDYLESEWIKQLKGKYNVKIDDQVFVDLKKSLGNE